MDGGKPLAEAPPAVPAERLLFDRDAAETHRWPPELLLRRQGLWGLIPVVNLRRGDEVVFGRTRRAGRVSAFIRHSEARCDLFLFPSGGGLVEQEEHGRAHGQADGPPAGTKSWTLVYGEP